ncbi:lysophospholipid acyltransferase family protein [Marinicella sp. W31]|uniref:lysophospholipid acyltransferase family protein n=1 Tax=Marinicella sp. W31 TaxID=3023713 RepID=UPI0037578CB7
MFAKFCHWILKIFGWRIRVELPDTRKFVLIAAPHTSNWDFIVGILVRFAIGLKINFLGKASLFKPPFGWIFSSLGGIPVERNSRQNMVEQMVEEFAKRTQLCLALAPEGSRSPKEYWKTGFYHIAYKAGVPIVMGTLNFKNKLVEIKEHFMPSGDIHKDMEIIRAYFSKIQGKNPHLQGPIRIPEDS